MATPLFSEALRAHQAGHLDRAKVLYERAIALGERPVDCWANLSVVGFQSRDYQAAQVAAERAIALAPQEGNNYNNLGLALKGLRDGEGAIAAFQTCVQYAPRHGTAWANLAGMLYQAHRWEEGVEAAEQALKFAPQNSEALEAALYLKLETASWDGLDRVVHLVDHHLRRGGVVNPYALFSCCIDPQVLLRAGRNTSAAAAHRSRDLEPWDGRAVAPSGKIRLGYFSSNLRTHATGYLIREMIRRHDRDRFEILALPYAQVPEDDFTRDLLARFDRVIQVADADNATAVQILRSLHLDILIDINGHADGGRTAVTAARCAPLQVAWLGYAATMGADFIDYTITDANVTPDALVSSFGEAVLRLPRTYYPSDPYRPVSQRFQSRHQLGLPEEGLVFCAFNQTRKITPPLAEVWASLLRTHPNSVLWLWRLNDLGVRNLQRFFQDLGVEPNRILWAPSLPSPDHLCRYRFADIYLDTYPYNGHTMVNDALFMGLPVVTLAGQTMPSRVAGSFLALIGRGDLIARDLRDYLEIANRLARDPDLRREMGVQIREGARRARLFSAEAFVRDFEKGLLAIVNHARQGKSPTSMNLAMPPR